MRCFLCTLVVTIVALAPLTPAERGAVSSVPPHPVFGPSLHLLDPSRYPADDPHYARQLLPDAEPSLDIASDGTVWVASIHLRHGSALWRGSFGRAAPVFVGEPDRGTGGYDVALAVSAGTPATLYTASLTSVSAPQGSWHISATSCLHGADSRAFATCIYQPLLDLGRRDRPWLAAYGRSTAYLSYLSLRDGPLAARMTLLRSVDGGRQWSTRASPVAALDSTAGGWPGNLAVDQRGGAVYQIFATGGAVGNFNRLVLAASRDGGARWRDTAIYQGAAGEDDANVWPSLAVDAAGRLYAAWSDRHHVYLAVSADGGITWSTARQVDMPAPGLSTSVMPWVAAGAAGHVALAWYGGDAADTLASSARWRVYFAESNDGGQSLSQVAATGVIHRGPVCTNGDACPWWQRQLLDFFQLALDPRSGRAAIAYSRSIEFGDYRGCRRAASCPQTYYVEETAH